MAPEELLEHLAVYITEVERIRQDPVTVLEQGFVPEVEVAIPALQNASPRVRRQSLLQRRP